MTDDFARQVTGIGALAEPARRALYLYVVAQPEPVSRDQAAAGVDLPRHTAKFHLDRLVDEGLLETEFRRLSGRQGPGAGRPSKLYRRARRQVEVTLPGRHYELAGAILAAAIEAAADGDPVLDAVARTARAAGRRMATSVTEHDVTRADPEAHLDALADVLRRYGYEPRREGDRVVLANCPFHALARDHTQLVCSMNLEVVTALAEELCTRQGGASPEPGTRVEARLDPEPGRCCVTLAVPSG